MSLAKAWDCCHITATSLDSQEILVNNYTEAEANYLKELRDLGCTILHDFDAYTMKHHPLLNFKLFDRIVFNFPHAGFIFREHTHYMIEFLKIISLSLIFLQATMKQRIDVKVSIKNDKHRSKAMQIVAGMLGVSSVTIGGDDKNILIVIGNEVDAVTLTKSLIKKLGSATLVRVVPLDDGRFDQEQAEASMTYEGQSNNYGYYNYSQPKYGYYNIPPVHEQYPRPYYYQYQRPDEYW